MNIAVYTRNPALRQDERFVSLCERLKKSGFSFSEIHSSGDISKDIGMVMSLGGDGTFLSASKRVGESGIPIIGVNMGRVGFLSEYTPEEAADALSSGAYSIEDRSLLKSSVEGEILESSSSFWPYTLNEISVHRSGAAILGVEVSVNGNDIPTYWADGLLVSTSSGSTAYSLSVGGPICTPDSKVLIIAPIAPHNLNVRPLIVPETTKIRIKMRSRDGRVQMSMDNRSLIVKPDATICVEVAQFSLKKVRLEKSNFFKALTTKLFWGEDIRNNVKKQ
jgi:NAD+ kinase